ncbi:MAG: hypothetical protein JWP01_2190 [Myxococcales bacterium]|nr:hypothetical protein [Myxococcales bacterium]
MRRHLTSGDGGVHGAVVIVHADRSSTSSPVLRTVAASGTVSSATLGVRGDEVL